MAKDDVTRVHERVDRISKQINTHLIDCAHENAQTRTQISYVKAILVVILLAIASDHTTLTSFFAKIF